MRLKFPQVLAMIAAITLPLGCDGGGEDPYAVKPKSKNLNDLKQSAPDVSPEEAEAKRKELGIKTNDEIAAENAKMFEKGAREYVKTRLGEYRSLITDTRAHLDGLEKDAPKWAEAKDPQAAYDKFASGHKDWAKEYRSRYDTLTGHGAEGGNVQAVLGKAFRTWQDLDGALGPEVSKGEGFAKTLADIRKTLDEVSTALDDIEKDESLNIDETYDPKKAAVAEKK